MSDDVRARADGVRLCEAPTGIFRTKDGAYGFKSEYRRDNGSVEAYCLDSGEAWWGTPPQTVERQRDEIVYPVDMAALRAALAAEAADASASPVDATTVAPATAQPVACGTHVIVTKRLKSDGDGVPPMGVYEVVDRARSTTGYIAAKHGKVVWLLAPGEFEEIVVPLAPPATGDAAAVREACARLCESFKEHLWSGAAAPGTHAGSVATLLAGAIRRIPLPVPATAVEEARKAVIEKAKRWRDMDDENDDAGCVELSEAVDALLAAEAEAAATHAAKGGNCG